MSERVPEGWCKENISSVARLEYGKSPISVKDEGGPYPIIGTSGIVGSASESLWEKQSVVIGRKGTINKPLFVPKPFWAIDTTYFCKFPKTTDPKWFYYKIVDEGLERYNEASGVPSLSRDTLNSVCILVPPLLEQEKIAAILTSVDDVIETTQKQIDKLQDLKKATMNELLTKGIGHTEFKDSELGRIPKSWEVAELLNCVDRIVDCEHKTAPEIEYSDFFVVSTNAVRDGELVEGNLYNTSKEAFERWTSRAIPKEGDVMFTREAPAGESCCVPKNRNVCLGQRMVLLRPNSEILNGEFLNFFLSSDAGKNSVYQMSLGTTVARINMADINKLKIPLPALSEQKLAAKIISGFEVMISKQKSKMEKFHYLKRSLMHDLLTGKVRVQVT